jgi:prophage regulatory protein
MTSKSYRPKQAAELLGIGIATLWRWAKDRDGFPQPIRLSSRCTVFDGPDLISWRDCQAAKSKPINVRGTR